MDRRRQSIFGKLVQTCLLLSILLVASSRGCDLQECIDTYNEKVLEQPSSICELISTAETCISPCGFSIPYFDFERQLNEDRANNCTGVTTMPPPCDTQLPDFNDNLDIMVLEDPVISYEKSDSVCFQDPSEDKRHCSMFTYSHIRQFSQNTIQTCSLDGQQTLIENTELSIRVTAGADTNLHMIQLAIYPDVCTGYDLLTYDASALQELPLEMTNNFGFDPGLSSVEVNVNLNKTVASILLPWLGMTIVIHHYANHLGIVVHMPTEMAELVKGLCGEGCSEDQQIDAVEHIKGYCPSNQESSMLSCKSKSSLLDDLQDAELREQYLMACQVDVLNSQAYDVISVMSAVVTTYQLLPNNDEIAVDANVSSASGSGEGGSGHSDLLPTLPPIELNCTHLSSQSPNMQLLAEPEMNVNLAELALVPGHCSPRVPKGDALRECAMFTYSHLSPFNSYTVQTPSVPGSWILLQYESLLVTVRGVADPVSPNFAKLEEVNITLHSPDCTYDVVLSYMASASASLPQEMTYSDLMFKSVFTPLLLESDGNLTSMHIPMLNATIVIRRNAGFLSVVARVPAQFVPSTEGLCNGGFPQYSPDEFDDFLSEQNLICPDEYGQTFINCYSAVEPKMQFLDSGATFSVEFVQACRFDILKSLSYNGMSMIRSISSDLVLLWDVGIYVYPSVESPTVATDPPEPSLSPSPTSIYSVTEISTNSESELSTTVTDPLESPFSSSSSLAHSSTITSATLTALSQSPLSPSLSVPPTAVATSTQKETQSVLVAVPQETLMPSETPKRVLESPRPSRSPRLSRSPKPSRPPKPPPKVDVGPEEQPLSETPSSGKTHCYMLPLLSLLVALSLTLAFHLL